MNRHTWKVALFLFGSGMCALVYQTAWMRELRLVFGGSTASSSAVLAIFMGGLGLGSLVLGPRSDRRPRPLEFYAVLELLIAGSAALSPLLIWLVRELYVALGGTPALGLGFGTAARLVLATLVLAVPTFLMGGTLPAAARAVETDDDAGRRALALLYGANTLGAVVGTALSTFLLLEAFGTRGTLWLACVVNAIVAALAWGAARAGRAMPEQSVAEAPSPPSRLEAAEAAAPAVSPAFVLAASAVVGFAFFLMEIVWYRMLGPLLGGSTFTFGLILAVALTGVGLGGAAYALVRGDARATLHGFALTCALEAVCVAAPFAIGDGLAVTASLLRSLGSLGFFGFVLAWTGVTAVVVLPAAFVAGFQFPLLIALLGHGRTDVGRHVGLAYAWNTAGAIAGAVVGGFGVLPFLTAPGAWRVVVGLLAVLGMAALGAAGARRFPARAIPAVSLALIAVLLVCATGPSAAWRHSAIGVGRANLAGWSTNELRNWVSARRRGILWEADGVESSVAISKESGFAFMVNGKSDGNARSDAGTQIMGGMILGLLNPEPKSAFVVGLGTGSTAGWLGRIPSVERVDVAELEPAILHVARLCAPVNGDVVGNPKVNVIVGDAREVLLTARGRYDVIFSEPSNPFRAGVASLFTREFYQAAAGRLADGGLFGQWLQTYEVDTRTVRLVVATLASVFPTVEIWHTQSGDLLLVGSMQPVAHDVAALREKVAREPFRSALFNAWRVTELEGVLAHHVARPSLARSIADAASAEGVAVNTDDRNLVEFGFARRVGTHGGFDVGELWETSIARGEDIPDVGSGQVDWTKVADWRTSMHTLDNESGRIRSFTSPDHEQRARAESSYVAGDLGAALRAWRLQAKAPSDPIELALVAEGLADAGSEEAVPYIERIRETAPIEADALLGRLRWRQGRVKEAGVALEAAFVAYRTDPWPLPTIMNRALETTMRVSEADGEEALRLFRAFEAPFAIYMLDEGRIRVRLKLARRLDGESPGPYTAEAVAAFEPNILWEPDFLPARLACYRATGSPLAEKARRDVDAFAASEPVRFATGLAE
jgi:spermidine synthase